MPDGSTPAVESTTDYHKVDTVYNLSIENVHTFFIASAPILVHNSCINPTAASRIQQVANRIKTRITVVGSRAAGSAGPLSDWDYLIGGNSRARGLARQLLPRGRAGGEIGAFGGETGIDIFNENLEPLNPELPHVIFDPQT